MHCHLQDHPFQFLPDHPLCFLPSVIPLQRHTEPFEYFEIYALAVLMYLSLLLVLLTLFFLEESFLQLVRSHQVKRTVYYQAYHQFP